MTNFQNLILQCISSVWFAQIWQVVSPSCDGLFHVSLGLVVSSDLNLCLAQHKQTSLFHSCLWTARKTSLSDWLMLRRLVKTSPLIGPQACWKLAMFVSLALIHARPQGRLGRRKQGWECCWSFYQSSAYLCTLALELYFPGQNGKHTKSAWQCSFFIFCLNPTPFSPSFSLAADYDVHSLLSAWLRLASNQQPALHYRSSLSCSPDHSRAHPWFFFSRQRLASSCLLFDSLLTSDKQNLTGGCDSRQTVKLDSGWKLHILSNKFSNFPSKPLTNKVIPPWDRSLFLSP